MAEELRRVERRWTSDLSRTADVGVWTEEAGRFQVD